MRVISGKIASDVTCLDVNKQVKEKIGHMFRLEGKKQEPVREAVAGEIAHLPRTVETAIELSHRLTSGLSLPCEQRHQAPAGHLG